MSVLGFKFDYVDKMCLSVFDIRDWFEIIIRESVNDFVIMTITAIHPARVTWDLDLIFCFLSWCFSEQYQ